MKTKTVIYDEQEKPYQPSSRKFEPEEIDKERLLPRLRERERRVR